MGGEGEWEGEGKGRRGKRERGGRESERGKSKREIEGESRRKRGEGGLLARMFAKESMIRKRPKYNTECEWLSDIISSIMGTFEAFLIESPRTECKCTSYASLYQEELSTTPLWDSALCSQFKQSSSEITTCWLFVSLFKRKAHEESMKKGTPPLCNLPSRTQVNNAQRRDVILLLCTNVKHRVK